jgi:hypothetical protein
MARSAFRLRMSLLQSEYGILVVFRCAFNGSEAQVFPKLNLEQFGVQDGRRVVLQTHAA